jgi:hypothetical protein
VKRCLVMKSDFDGDYLASDLKRGRDRRCTAISGPPDLRPDIDRCCEKTARKLSPVRPAFRCLHLPNG